MASTQCQVRAGWSGRFYEDLAVGDVYRSRWGHTVTEVDNALFTHLTHNTNPLLPRDNQDENAATIKMRKPRRLAAL